MERHSNKPFVRIILDTSCPSRLAKMRLLEKYVWFGGGGASKFLENTRSVWSLQTASKGLFVFSHTSVRTCLSKVSQTSHDYLEYFSLLCPDMFAY